MSNSEGVIRNLNIRQTWLEEEVEQVYTQLNLNSLDDAFLYLSISLLFNEDYDSVQPDEIVDGGQDKQIDFIRVEDDPDRGSAHIHIIQAKKTTGFSSNTLIQMRNGLSWLFERPKSEYGNLDNPSFVNKIGEVRQARKDYTPSNLSVSVYLVTLGDASLLSSEFLQERKILVDTYSNAGFNEFRFREIGAFELYELLNQNERTRRRIEYDIPIIYDINKPSLIEYRSGETKSLICSVSGENLAKLASVEPRDAIFDLNVRQYYGARGRVNPDIEQTCQGEESARFWLLNNGVTMICDSFDLINDPDETRVRVKSPQIVNGCQTTVTLRESWERNLLKADVKILLRIYATDNANLVKRITLTTNNQNRITDRDLRANDPVQDDIQRMLREKFEYFYERKSNEFKSLRGEQRKRVIPNDKAAQAYLAVVRRKPSVARGYPGKIWSEHYEEIFKNMTAEDILLSYLIYKYCHKRSRMSAKNYSTESEVAVYGAFHLARICGYLLTKDEWGYKYRKQIVSAIQSIENDEHYIERFYFNAFNTLLEIWSAAKQEYRNPMLYFKANDVQKTINSKLKTSSDDV